MKIYIGYNFCLIGIYGGNLLGIRSVSGLAFYDWETTDLVRRIEITPKNVSAYKLLFTCEKNNTRSEWISRILNSIICDIFKKPDIVTLHVICR